MNKPLSRKQREILLRKDYILEVARDIIAEDGYIGFTIDRVAEATEYAKGTIYQMFANKEEIIASLCLQNGKVCLDLFERANEFNGSSRERLAAINVAHHIHVLKNPDGFNQQLLIKNSSIRNKINDEMSQQMLEMESNVVSVVTSIAQEAIDKGEIKTDLSAPSLVFNLWSLCFGCAYLMCSDIELDKHGMTHCTALNNDAFIKMLDGYKWEPLHNETEYKQTIQRIAAEVFPAEFKETGLHKLLS